MSKTDKYTEIEPFLRKNQSKTEMLEPLYNTSIIKNCYKTEIFSIEICVKSRSFKLNQLKSHITNVKLVQNWYYKC